MRELIAVHARFSKENELVPLAFIRDGKKFSIQSIGRTEVIDGVRRYLVTTAGSEVYEIGFDLERKLWGLYRAPQDFHPKTGRGMV